MSEPPSEVYSRFPSDIDDIFSYGSQHPENIEFKLTLERRAKARGFRLMKMTEVCGLREESIEPLSKPEESFDYLGLADIESDTGRIITYERLLGKDILSKATMFYKGDIVFGRLRPYLNKVHLVEKDAAIGSGELYVVIPHDLVVRAAFLVRYLLSNLTRTQTKWILTGNSYPRLSETDFLNLSVIVPDLSSKVQDEIVQEVKKLEAEALVDSAKASGLVKEAYGTIPKRLSITVPEGHDYDYYSMPTDDLHDRLDFNYNLPDYRELVKELDKSPDVVKFSELLDDERGLTNGVEIRRFVEAGTPYLRVSDVTGDELRLEEAEKVTAKLGDLKKDIRLEVGNLVLSRSGTLGITLLVDDTFPIDNLILSSHLIRVVLKEKAEGRSIHPAYVAYFLRSSIGQMQINQVSLGSSVPEVNHPLLSDMRIIIPEASIQSEIENEVDAKLKEASIFKRSAADKWKASRDRFVSLLLGEPNSHVPMVNRGENSLDVPKS